MLKPKQENDKMLKTLREIVSSGSNRQCFDCSQRGVTYVNMTIGSFVCTTCSGVLRGLTPPHRVKSISMATFTSDELDFVRTHGNDECAKTWLGLWDSKRTLKQDHRDFMIDKYERKRYYLEPASPLKSITTSSSSSSIQQQASKSIGSHHSTDSSNLSVHKLTPPAPNNRHHHHQQRSHAMQNGHDEMNGNSQNNHTISSNNFFTNNLNGKTSSQNGSIKSDNSCNNDFVADFGKASIYNSNNSLNSNESGGQINGRNGLTNGYARDSTIKDNKDLNANFADFENNKIYNAAEEYYNSNNNSNNNSTNGLSTNSNNIQWNIWQHFQWPSHSNSQPEQNRWSLPMSTSSLSNNSLNSSSGTFTSNSSLNSTTPSADRYAALKDLDEQLRETKAMTESANGNGVEHTNPTASPAIPVNPFKNPFQAVQQNSHIQSQQNWTIPESPGFFSNGFGSPLNQNGFSNGFYYANNMTNGIISQPLPFSGKTAFGNPFMTTGTTTASTNNPFL